MQSALTRMGGRIGGFAQAPAGPFYIHFWAPNFKWALAMNNLMDYNRPTENISLSMNSALTLSGTIFMRWAFVITPVSYSLFLVNAVIAASSSYHLARKVKADYFSSSPVSPIEFSNSLA